MFLLMFNDLFLFRFLFSFFSLNISLILFCQPYCQQVLNPDKLKLFNYLNPGPRNQVQWFIPVCMRHAGEETTLGADGWPLCVCLCVWARGFKQKALFTALRKPDVPSCHNLAMSKSCVLVEGKETVDEGRQAFCKPLFVHSKSSQGRVRTTKISQRGFYMYV